MKTEKTKLYLAIGFIAILALLGGSSRADAIHQTPLRLIALALFVVGLWYGDQRRLSRNRPLLAILAMAALLPALQLVPLPPSLWAAIPGRGYYQEIIELVGLAPTWRPLTFTPTATLNALLSMIIPATALILTSQVGRNRQILIALAILLVAVVSLGLGYAQIAQGPDTGLRHYRPTNTDAMVGLFANRNHHALLLAIALPLLFLFGAYRSPHKSWNKARLSVCLPGILIVCATLLAAGSRAGLILGAFGLLTGALLFHWMRAHEQPQGHTKKNHPHKRMWYLTSRIWAFAGAVAIGLLVSLIALFGNRLALERFWKVSPIEERRVQLFEPMWDLTTAMWPFGSGLGSFATMFQRFERYENLDTSYVNNAHNDFIQLIIEGGAIVLAPAFLFLWWWCSSLAGLIRRRKEADLEIALALTGVIITLMAAIASLVDYPLRTPIHAAIFVSACCWMQLGRKSQTRPAGTRRVAKEAALQPSA